MRKRLSLFLLVLNGFAFKSIAQASWSKLYNFCPDTVFSSDIVVMYTDGDVIMTAGHTYTPGISAYHSYIASYDYSGNLINRKMLYSPGEFNMLIAKLYDHITNPLKKISDNKYVLLAVEQDFAHAAKG